MNDPFAPAPRDWADPVVQPDELDAMTSDAAAESADESVAESIDLDAIERDLTDVQTALGRLDDGTYWTDEVTGVAIPDDVLASFPLTRTVAGRAAQRTDT